MPGTTIDSCCAPVTAAVLDEEAATRLATVFKALSDPARLRLLSMIAVAEPGEACGQAVTSNESPNINDSLCAWLLM